MTSILDGVRDGVRDVLDPNHLKGSKDSVSLINAAYERIKANWHGKKTSSRKNWELRFVPLPKDTNKKRGHTEKAEVPLERAIASAFEGMGTLWNQMPVASGLVEKSSKGRRRAVDLIYRPDALKDAYEFLELKVANNKRDTPKDAVIEVIEYGLLYLFSRHHAEDLGYSLDKKPILRASHIGLRVLAEREYYGNWLDAGYYTLGNLNNALDDFLKSRSNDFGELRMDFRFETFPSDFKCPQIVNGTQLNENLMASLRYVLRNKETYSRKPI